MSNPYEKFYRKVSKCTKCPLARTRKQVVVDRGNPVAKLAFIGEAPGFNEDKQGQALVGKPGEKLDSYLREEGLDPVSDVCVFNVLKCRPPRNRFPGDNGSDATLKDLKECLPWLDQQIQLIGPRVVVLVGKRAAQWVLFRGKGRAPAMRELARNWYRSEDIPGIEFFAMYHPAFLLRKEEEDPGLAEEIEELTRRAIRRAASAVDGKLPRRSKPEVIPAISFKRDSKQGTLF